MRIVKKYRKGNSLAYWKDKMDLKNGHYIQSDLVGEPWSDFAEYAGRTIYGNPFGVNDTVYWTKPTDYIGGTGYWVPIGQNQDQDLAKQQFYNYLKKAKPLYNNNDWSNYYKLRLEGIPNKIASPALKPLQ